MDRYQFVKTATSKGMPEEQALAIAAYVQETQSLEADGMVTKHYLDARLSDLKAEMLKWYVGIAMVQTVAFIGALLTIAKSLPH